MEDKGFKVIDRRGSEKGEDSTASGDAASSKEDARANVDEPLFISFIISLYSAALMHFGEIQDPSGKAPEVNIEAAKEIIDVISVIEKKTKGNLTQDEEKSLAGFLYDLRMKYLEKSGKL